jgi:hypothetical protein
MRFQPSQHSSYDGPRDYLAAKLKKSGDAGFYADTGGNGWYLDPSLTLFKVFAKGGGERKALTPGTPEYNQVYARVVTDKKPITKVVAAANAKKSGGKETKTKAAVTKSTGIQANLQGKTWNDGSYTYVVDRLGNVTIGTKVFKKGDPKYATVIANLNKDYSDGKLSEGSAPEKPKAAYNPPPMPASVPAPTDASAGGGTVEVPLTEQPWFWPAVAGGTVLTGVAVWYFLLRTPPQPVEAPA